MDYDCADWDWEEEEEEDYEDYEDWGEDWEEDLDYEEVPVVPPPVEAPKRRWGKEQKAPLMNRMLD